MSKKLIIMGIVGIFLVYALYSLFVPTNTTPPEDHHTEVGTSSAQIEDPASVAPSITIISGVLSQAETFYESLQDRNVPMQAINTIVSHLSDLIDFRKCRPGTRYDIGLSPQGEVVECRYEVSPIEIYTLKEEKGSYSVYKEDVELEKHVVKFSGEINSCLFESFSDSGESERLTLAFADIFSSDIDFNTEPQSGDRFTVIFEKYFKDGQFVGYGHILAAWYESKSDVFEAYYYVRPGEEKGAYYDARGKSLGKTFLRSPVPFSRLTSGFSRSRKHPILGVYRPHLGIDLAAPTGTPVLAASDGRVIFRGWRGGYGRQIILKHSGAYKTYYGHLSRFARGIKPGVKVKQGQVIGYVGASGLATGPHLDYRIEERGVFRNPFSLRFKPKTVLKGAFLKRFLAKKKEMSDWLGIAASRYEKRLGTYKASQVSLI